MLRLAGSAADTLAARFSIERDSVYRHMQNHVSDDTKAALIADVPLSELAERAAAEGNGLLDYLSLIRSTVLSQMLGAASINDRSATAALAGRGVDVLKEIGRLTGELLNAAPITNITNNNLFMQSPVFNRLEQMLLERLAPFPDALQSVMGGLEALEREQDGHGRPMMTLEASHAAAA